VTEVRDNPDEHRFEIYDNGQLAGFARYSRRPGRVFFVHTEVDPAFGGRGLGGKLAAGALDETRATGDRVVPLCPFIAHFIERNPAYADLVDHELVAQLERGR
jgi:predicted GNAT family acetyltransferase